MKEVKIIAIATIITICLIISCAFATATADELNSDFYWKQMIVVSCENAGEEQLVLCEDRYGMIWGFYDEEYEWDVGDYGYLLMWIGTDDPTDDEVIDVEWYGYTEKPEYFWRYDRTNPPQAD